MILFLLPSRLRARLKRREPLVRMTDLLLLMFIMSWVFTFVLRYVEDLSVIEAIWQVWQTATTVGYGNRPAESVVGRIVTMLFGLSQIVVFGAMIGAVFDYRQDAKERRILGHMRNPHRKGYVVFNFPGEAEFRALIQELRYVEDDVPICVVDDRITSLPSTVAPLHNIHFVHGSTLARETYERARID